jgi:hypothetical protein
LKNLDQWKNQGNGKGKFLHQSYQQDRRGRAFSNSKYLTLFSLALIASELKLTVLHLRKSTMMF